MTDPSPTFAWNANRRDGPPRAPGEAMAYHRTLAGYAPTPVASLRELASELGVAEVAVKDESARLGTASFKILGSSWAVRQRVARELDGDAARARALTLCTASDGNYGVSMAEVARILGCRCLVVLPRGTAGSRIREIERRGGRVELIDGSYDDAVATARDRSAADGSWYCPDTDTPDDVEAIHRFVADVADGYRTIFEEWAERPDGLPDLLFVQAGVGGLASAALAAVDALSPATRVVLVEPVGSACVQRSIEAGEPVSVADTFTTMAGLRCQTVSATAWPTLRDRTTGVVTVTDDEAAAALAILARAGVRAGESGAAGLAGAIATLSMPAVRERLGVGPSTRVGVVNTEGPVTDQP